MSSIREIELLNAISSSLSSIATSLGGGGASGLDQAEINITDQDTPVQFPDKSSKVAWISVKTASGGFVCIGGDDVNADFANSNSGQNAPPLYKGQVIVMTIDNLNNIYVSGNAGDKIVVMYTK